MHNKETLNHEACFVLHPYLKAALSPVFPTSLFPNLSHTSIILCMQTTRVSTMSKNCSTLSGSHFCCRASNGSAGVVYNCEFLCLVVVVVERITYMDTHLTVSASAISRHIITSRLAKIGRSRSRQTKSGWARPSSTRSIVGWSRY